jgi:hypothetical protein
LARWIFSTIFVILSGQGIDVIFGMSWMKFHKALLGIAACSVSAGEEIRGDTCGLRVSGRVSRCLPGMPPEGDIELEPGIVPIAKSPYQVMTVELAELKI